MNDTRTETEKYEAWLNAVIKAWNKYWRCEAGWIFISPSGTRHDLSAADMNQLLRIEREGLFLVE